MGRHVMIEAMHLAGGVLVAIVAAYAAAWAVPLAANDVWMVDLVAVLIILFMGIRPLREARARDRSETPGNG